MKNQLKETKKETKKENNKGEKTSMKKATNKTTKSGEKENMKTENKSNKKNSDKKAKTSGLMYTVVGREMSGTTVLKYELVSSSGANRKVTKDQLHDLVLQKKVTNCMTRIYQGEILFKGKGIDIKNLAKKDMNTKEESGLKDSLSVVALTPNEAILKNQRGKEFSFELNEYEELKKLGFVAQKQETKTRGRKPKKDKEAI